jgi:hypothetical protein
MGLVRRSYLRGDKRRKEKGERRKEKGERRKAKGERED